MSVFLFLAQLARKKKKPGKLQVRECLIGYVCYALLKVKFESVCLYVCCMSVCFLMSVPFLHTRKVCFKYESACWLCLSLSVKGGIRVCLYTVSSRMFTCHQRSVKAAIRVCLYTVTKGYSPVSRSVKGLHSQVC